MSSPLAQYCICLAGPTAVGKSAVALHLAVELGGEILTVDSMQVYKGMDIGTAKPTASDQATVPHHLLDLATPGQPFDAGRYVECAKQAIDAVLSRGRVPVLCGGTGLYFQGLLHGLGNSPESDPALRALLETTPLPTLLEELKEKDPATYARVDQCNPRRVIRAVEVLRLTGGPISGLRAAWNPPAQTNRPGALRIGSTPSYGFVLSRPSESLKARIDARVELMFAQGLVEETQRLLHQGLGGNRTAQQAIGYHQVLEYLDGKRDLAATVQLVKQRTRQYAKKQLTWFRRHMQAEWIEIPDSESPAQTAKRIQDGLRQATTNALNIT